MSADFDLLVQFDYERNQRKKNIININSILIKSMISAIEKIDNYHKHPINRPYRVEVTTNIYTSISMFNTVFGLVSNGKLLYCKSNDIRELLLDMP